jgi:hypothetical protein
MNPFGFVLRWLDRRILRVLAAERRAMLAEGRRRAELDAVLSSDLQRLAVAPSVS